MGFQNSNNPFNELEVFATSWHDYISDSVIQESYFSNHYSLMQFQDHVDNLSELF